MLDGVVAFDVELYSHRPGRLRSIAFDLEQAASRFRQAGDEGATAARRLLELADWVDREAGRAQARWDRIEAIPGFHVFEEWDHDRFVWNLDWLSDADGRMHTYEELVALSTAHHEVAPLLARIGAGDPLDRDDVDDVLDALATVDHPQVAAPLLDAIGADGFRQLHEALAATTDPADDGDLERLEAGLATLTALFATASRASWPRHLSDGFVEDLCGPLPDPPPVGEERASDLDEAREALGALDFGRGVSERLLAVAGQDGAALVLQRAGRPFALLTIAMPLAELLEDGVTSEFAESAINAGLTVVALSVSNPLVTLGVVTLGAIVSLIFATADDGGRPRRPTRGGSNPGGPGTSTADHFLNDHGVPVTANGI